MRQTLGTVRFRHTHSVTRYARRSQRVPPQRVFARRWQDSRSTLCLRHTRLRRADARSLPSLEECASCWTDALLRLIQQRPPSVCADFGRSSPIFGAPGAFARASSPHSMRFDPRWSTLTARSSVSPPDSSAGLTRHFGNLIRAKGRVVRVRRTRCQNFGGGVGLEAIATGTQTSPP